MQIHPQRSCVILPVDAATRAVDLRTRLQSASERLIGFHVADGAEQAFDEDDAALSVAVADLPSRDSLPLAYVDGPIGGRHLALLLRCALPVVGPNASLVSGFDRPASAAVYAAAAGRVGASACERLLFGAAPIEADLATSSGLTLFAESLDAAIALAETRFMTMLCVAKANLITWPFSSEMARALVDAGSRRPSA